MDTEQIIKEVLNAYSGGYKVALILLNKSNKFQFSTQNVNWLSYDSSRGIFVMRYLLHGVGTYSIITTNLISAIDICEVHTNHRSGETAITVVM